MTRSYNTLYNTLLMVTPPARTSPCIPQAGGRKISARTQCSWAGTMLQGCDYQCSRDGTPPAGRIGPPIVRNLTLTMTLTLIVVDRSLYFEEHQTESSP